MEKHIVAGVDIGGTHVTACLIDLAQGVLLPHTRMRSSIDPSLPKEEVVSQWAAIIQQCFGKAQLPVGLIGIAMPGPFDYEKGISYIKGLHKYEDLYGHNIKKMLSAALQVPQAQVLMMNDASAFLLGEMRCGSGKGFQNMVGITLGTGLGSAAYFDGRLHDGDLWCMPFADSRAEDYLSARWLLQAYETGTGQKLPHVKALAERVATDAHAAAVVASFGANLAKVLVHRYKEQAPQVIVIGGNIAKAWTYFGPALQATLNQQDITFLLKPAALGEDAALIGAGYLHG